MKLKLSLTLLCLCFFQITFSQVANPVSNLHFCDNNNDGDDTNGLVQNINLDVQTSTVLGSQNATDFTVSYHSSASDANAGINNLSSPFSNTIQHVQIIYVRVTENISSTFDITNFNIVVNSLPSFQVISPQVVCLNGSPLTISVESPASVYDYLWTNPSGSMFTSSEITITSGGIYTVTAISTTGTGCSRTRQIQVNESIIATITNDDLTIVDQTNNNFITIDPTNLGIGNYEYSLTNESNATVRAYQDALTFENLDAGIYNLLVQDKNGCGVTSIQFTINDNVASIEDLNQVHFSLYPNPTNHNLTLQFSGHSFSDFEAVIYNIKGKVIYKTNLTISQQTANIDISTMASGVYFVKIISNNKTAIKKFIVGSD